MLFDTSVLDRVKKRLNGSAVGEDVPDTQIIPVFETSILFGNASTQEIPAKNEGTKKVSEGLDVPRAIRLPQLSLDESEFNKLTQVIQRDFQTQDEMMGSTQIIPEQTQANHQDASVEIEQTSDKEDQNAILAAELTHVSLTDEENDLHEEADTSRDSSIQKTVTTKAELQHIEQGLSEQKRLKNIQPQFEGKSFDPTKQLLDAFESDSDVEEEVNSEHGVHLSPVTSPIKIKDGKLEHKEVASDSDFEIDVLDLISNTSKKPPQKKKLSPIEEYAEKLKKQLNSSPTSSHTDMIALDDSDSDGDFDGTKDSPIPQLSKEQAFVIRQKFSRQQSKASANHSKFHPESSRKQANSLFNELRRANAKQILDLKEGNPDSELMEEIEKEEEEMGNLLEREMERVRRIRKKEKLLEKTQKALLDDESDEDYDDKKAEYQIDQESEVPDSDVDSEVYESDDEEDVADSEDEMEVPEKRTNRARRIISSDEDEETNECNLFMSQKPNLPSRTEERTDDSYMFGGQTREPGDNDSDGPIMQIHSDMTRPGSPVDSEIDQNIGNLRSELHKLFSNLPPPTAKQESSVIEPAEVLQYGHVSFRDNLSTQIAGDDNSFVLTQVDGTSSQATSTQHKKILHTQEDSFLGEEDDDIHLALDRGRTAIRANAQQANLSDVRPAPSSDEEAEEVSEQLLQERLAMYEAKIRRKELKARKLRKEMERKGMKGIVEGEAEESDDEWKGIGGNDKEDSDQADSEDERMIDNTLNIDLNDEEVRKKFMEQYQIKDRNELEKLMDDIKNHRLTKRSRSNRLDIELSDEEDEILMAYRRQKLEEQKQRLLENQKMMQSSRSDKTKAFFDSIQEEPNYAILPESETSDDELAGVEKLSNSPSCRQSDADEGPKKSIILEESFVQKQLSFLSKTEEDDYVAIQLASDRQHGVDDDVEDVSALKKRCLSNLYSRPASVGSFTESRKRPQEEVQTDEDEDDLSRVFKKPSMVSSFRTYREKSAAQVSTNSFSGVTVNKHFKAASASKSSITYMSKQSKARQVATSSFKSSKAIEIEERVDRAKLESGFLGGKYNFS
ncbi:hypothetical protein METBIDRAFT_33605 [Metschnikowia bicuspidata var. bicuspidata NRRL YB-4993]|uniref:DNA replication checkpoint mediator MRC1 domain-containing protein n=1 Tax=Metschnikowia bicuspidata var. bicuspidata NRRL YB-4993 TaxID=869754 RepID=A0A1A0H4X2_9ASCO|nr:hypothetical protein METBIDRAFT_33605 [Metschnikowia bicuspidata var. bicuspidata NRRL YB-4993]OBA18973.1 hypothetical protein METBIDRAFT_33605 [Metschnikowia bicuspidata var. bicuspidata NRRL YB-4993]